MKNLILLFIIFPFSVFANFYRGSITFNDSSIKEGFIEIPWYDDSKIKFKVEKNSNIETYNIEDVKSFEIINEINETEKYTTLTLSRPKLFGKTHIKIDSKKSWVRIVKEGKITLYSADYIIQYNRGIETGVRFYVKKTNEDFGRFINDKPNNSLTVIINEYKTIVHYLKFYFEQDCPKYVETLNSNDIKKNGMKRIVELYDQNCGE